MTEKSDFPGLEDPQTLEQGTKASDLDGEAAFERPQMSIVEHIQKDAQSLRRAVTLLSHGSIALVAALHIGATTVLTGIVFARPFPYPFMYPLMGILLLSLLGIRTIAVLTKKRATAIRALVTNVIMHAFFLYVLLDQIPARTVVMKGLVERPDQWILLVPIGMYIATMIGTVVHGLLAGYLAKRPAVEVDLEIEPKAK
jgi:hypothetical protein